MALSELSGLRRGLRSGLRSGLGLQSIPSQGIGVTAQALPVPFLMQSGEIRNAAVLPLLMQSGDMIWALEVPATGEPNPASAGEPSPANGGGEPSPASAGELANSAGDARAAGGIANCSINGGSIPSWEGDRGELVSNRATGSGSSLRADAGADSSGTCVAMPGRLNGEV